MHPITVSEDPLELCLALGVPFAPAHLPDGKESVWAGRSATPPRSVLLRWQTSAPADSSVEYRRRGARDWLRTVNPEARVDHRVVLSNLDPGEVYQVRIACRDTTGTPASARTSFRGTLVVRLPTVLTRAADRHATEDALAARVGVPTARLRYDASAGGG